MKNQKNKYAQLVEAQSPEPPETTTATTTTTTRGENEANNKEEEYQVINNAAINISGSVESVKSLTTGTEDRATGGGSQVDGGDLPTLRSAGSDNNCSSDDQFVGSNSSVPIVITTDRSAIHVVNSVGEDRDRTNSQDSDSSLMSTCFVSTTDSGRRSFSSIIEPSSGQQATISIKHNSNINNHYNNKQANNIRSNNKTNLKRTISQSMLQLDQSNRLDKFEVSWKNLTFSYGIKWSSKLLRGNSNSNKKKPLVLNNISGRFKSNQLVAIIGPSGCGKTTLLQFLAGNNAVHKNRLRISGLDEPKVAFIGQDDCLLPGLTAKETLIYASRLQNCQPNFNHQQHIMPILDGLGLAECAERSVTKLSGGQMKRVTIAQELLYPTNLLILDEVTSGLDASTSYSIIKLLKRLVSDKCYPMSIVMSIHQPSARLFAVFDQVYVMSEGSCLYEGSCKIDLVNSYLGRFGLECPKFHNIADYLIEVASEDSQAADPVGGGQLIREQMINYQRKQGHLRREEEDNHELMPTIGVNNRQEGNQVVESHQMVVVVADSALTKASTSTSSADNDSQSEMEEKEEEVRLNGFDENETIADCMMSHSLYDAVEKARFNRLRPVYNQFLVHFNRSLLRIRRSHILTYLQLVTYILLGLQLATFYGADIGTLGGCPQLPMGFLAFVFSNESSDSHALEIRRIQENMNFLLVAIMTATFAALEITVITFPLEAKTVKREWRNGWYRVTSYFMGRTLADLPFQLVFIIVFCLVVYTLTGQVGLLTWRFGSFVTIIVTSALIAQTVGFIFGALFMDNLPAAVFAAPLFIFPTLLFSGFFSRLSQIPTFYKPLTYLSHFRYAFEALIVTLYGYNRCNCDQEVLTSYNDSLKNQTVTIKDMFKSLFGSNDCAPNSEENSIEDNPPMQDIDPLFILSNHTSGTTIGSHNYTSTTAMPRPLGFIQTIKPIEDALVDSVFEHMSNSSEPAEFKGDAMDRLTQKFSTRITTMLNSQANFGHEVPQTCKDFNSYLMTEFELHNDDLIFGLLMLFVFVIISRLVCNMILTFTIARRTS